MRKRGFRQGKSSLSPFGSLDREVAAAWGELQGNAESRGEKLPVIDSLLAATANVHNLAVVTRNVLDMERCRAKVCNPWDESGM